MGKGKMLSRGRVLRGGRLFETTHDPKLGKGKIKEGIKKAR